jgi:hypothetical protein
MIGYSRLIGLDDAGTLERLRKLRKDLIDPAVDQHGGRIVQTGGDSLLIVFDSIDGAVRCAATVQRQVPLHDGDQPPDRAMRFRVGINIGDAIADGTDLHGEAVNIAVRLQSECPPGAICVTRAVRDHMQGRIDLTFEALGPLNLKNIAQPVEAFVLRPDAATVTPNSLFKGLPSVAREAALAALRLSPRDSLNVLPSAQIGVSYYFERDYPKALEAFNRAISRYPEFPLTYRFLAATLGQLGHLEEAHAALQRATSISPASFNFYVKTRPPWFRPEDYEHMLEGLRKAGWQD